MSHVSQQEVMQAWKDWFRRNGVSENVIERLIDKGPRACYWVLEAAYA